MTKGTYNKTKESAEYDFVREQGYLSTIKNLTRQRDELIEFSEKLLKFGIIKYPYHEQLSELITKTKHNE